MDLNYENKESKTAPSVDVEYQSGSVEATTNDEGTLGTVRRWIRSVGAEEFGIEPITKDMRTNQPAFDLCTIFLAANCNVTTLATGYLGPTSYGLGWWDSFLCILFFNIAGVIPPVICATLGPKLGLRTMIIPRYCFGWWPVKVIAFLNCINQIGWGIVSGITSGDVLYDVGGGQLPLAVAVLVVCLVGFAFGLLGYRILHIYDRYSWMVMLICFILLAGFGAKHFVNVAMPTGSLERADVFSFGVAIIGYELAWLPVAADYGVYMKDTINARKTGIWTFVGLFSSQVLIEWLGAAVGTLSQSADVLFTDAYNEGGVGGLIGAIFKSYNNTGLTGFGKFIEVLIAFSTSAVISTNIYSLGLSVQVISTKLLIVPRFVWSLIGGCILLACSIAGRDVLADVMTNFLSICTYWLTPFCTIVLLEHFIWRRGYKYDLSAWDDETKLPYGIAASISFVVGTVLSLLCMDQVWWVGPIALGIGPSPYGTDISWLLALGVCSLLYVPLRIWERRKWGL